MTTREQFATDLLTEAGWSISTEKIDALVAQASKEDAGARNNPLATTEPGPGATDYNSVGVKNYPSYVEGLAATVATLRNGHYPQLVGVLSDPAGGSALTYCTSVELNTWGTGNCLGFLESIRSGDPHGYLTHQIVGGGGAPTGDGLPPPPPTPAPAPPVIHPPFGEDTMQAVKFELTTDAAGHGDIAIPLPPGTTAIVAASLDLLSFYADKGWDADAFVWPAVGNPSLAPGFAEIVVAGLPSHYYTGHVVVA